jgi:hypothetical protein
MSLIKAIQHQVGLNTAPENNFTLTAQNNDGTMQVVRGGSTPQIVLSVDVNGYSHAITPPTGDRSTKVATTEMLDEQSKYLFVYPEGTSGSPYTYPVNTRKEYANPFPGKYINVEAEVFATGMWGVAPYIYAESSTQGIGISAHQINGNGAIVVQSGNHILFRSAYQGNPFGITATLDALPFRLRVSSIGDM